MNGQVFFDAIRVTTALQVAILELREEPMRADSMAMPAIDQCMGELKEVVKRLRTVSRL